MELKPIPISDGFFASSDGRIFDQNMVERVQYVNGDGYKTSSIKLPNRKWRTFGTHRLVALAFLPVEGPDNLTVNHRDIDKSNNDKSNLEWITNEQNNLHAALFRNDASKPIAYSVSEDETYLFHYDIQGLANHVSASVMEVWDAVKNGVTINGFRIIAFTNRTKIPHQLQKDRSAEKSLDRHLKAMDVITGNVLEFQSLKDAAAFFGTSSGHVLLTLANESKPKLLLGRYIVVRSMSNFPDFDEEDIRRLQSQKGFEVLVYSEVEERYYIYKSAAEFIRDKGLSKKAVTWRLRQGKIDKVAGYYFVYHTQEQKSRLYETIGRPGPNL